MLSMSSMERRRNAALGLAVGALVSLAGGAADAATTIVDLQPSWNWTTVDNVPLQRTASFVTGDFDGGGTNNDKIDRLDFDLTNRLNAANTNTVQSGVFYGGVGGIRFNDTTATANDNLLRNGSDPTPDAYTTGFRSSGGLEYRCATALIWKKADFLNGGATYPVHLSAGATVTLQARGFGIGSPVVRLLANSGGQLYVSEAWVSVSDSVYMSYTIALNSFENWAPINLTGSTSSDTTGMLTSPGAFAPFTPTNIDAVGFYVEKATGTNSDVRFAFRDFAVNAVPEPASMVLLTACGASLLIRRRKAI